MPTNPTSPVPPLEWVKVSISVAALLLSVVAIVLTLYRDKILQPQLRYSVTELDGYPGLGSGLQIAVKRPEAGDAVPLRWGIRVPIRSTGWSAASEIELRVTAKPGTVIVQVHTDNEALVEKLPDLGRQGSPEVTLAVRRMVPDENVVLTFWYGFPGGSDSKKPPQPAVLLRHAAALARRE
jgi:hypothetical protein